MVIPKVTPVERVEQVHPHKHSWVLYQDKRYRWCKDCKKIEPATTFRVPS